MKAGDLVEWKSVCRSCEAEDSAFVVVCIDELLNGLAVAYARGPSHEAIATQLRSCVELAADDQNTIVQDYFDVGLGRDQLHRLITETSPESLVSDVYVVDLEAVGSNKSESSSVVAELGRKGVTLHTRDGIASVDGEDSEAKAE